MKKREIGVSVVMGVYNQRNRQVLLDAVNSILNQTFSDFEFIIYDDGSDETAAEYIRKLRDLDERIILIGKEENHGLAFSLNECIRKANGKYIARMDADDIALPARLEKQVAFLEQHPEYMWCGTNTYLFDADGIWGERKMPEEPQKTDYLKFSPYIHPTVVYRTEIFTQMKGYDESSQTLRCEDYELFMRFHQAGYRGYNIQESLFQYREDKTSFARRSMGFRIQETKLRYRNFKDMHLLFPKGWIYVLRPLVGGLLPDHLLMWLKRKEAKHADTREKEESLVLQTNTTRKTNL